MAAQKNKKDTLKVSEFEWYEVETKVRQFVHDLLQPFQKKQVEESAKVNEVRKQLSHIRQKLNEHSYILGGDGVKPKVFQEMDKKIQDIQEQMCGVFRAEQRKRIADVEARHEYYDTQIARIEALSNSLQSAEVQRLEDHHVLLRMIQTETQALNSRIDTFTSDQATVDANLRQSLAHAEDRIQANQNRIKSLQIAMKNANKDIQVLQNESARLDQKAGKFIYMVNDLEKRIKLQESSHEISKKFLAVVDDLKNQFNFIQTYVEKYMPLFVQSQISDTLHSFISGRARRALCVYEQRAFNFFNQQILDGSGNGLENNINSYINTIQKIILRNKRFLIKLKVERRVKLGSKEYDLHILDHPINDDDEEGEAESPGHKVEMAIPQEKIRNLITQNWEKIADSFREETRRELGNAKLWLKEMQDIMEMHAVKNDAAIDAVRADVAKFIREASLQHVYFERLAASFQEKTKLAADSVLETKSLMGELAHFSSIVNHIVIQDQIDRQGIALYGLRESSKEMAEQPSVSMDSKCFSCSGFPASSLSAFKMACLAYNPSSVLIDGKSYKRQEVLELTTKILHNVKSKLSTIPLPVQQKSSIILPTPRSGINQLGGSGLHSHRSPQQQDSLQPSRDLANTATLKSKPLRSRHNSVRQSQGILNSSEGMYKTLETPKRVLPTVGKREILVKRQREPQQTANQSFYY